MSHRFQHGTVLPVNGMWRGYWYATTFDSNGIQTRRHTSRVLGSQNEMSKSDARKKLASIINQEAGPRPDSTVTFGHWIKTVWLPLRSPNWKHSTAEVNNSVAQNHIIKPLGHLPVTTLDKVTLQTHLNSIAQGYSTSVVAHVSAMIKSMCAELVETDLLMKNPARSLKIPKVKAEENRVLGYGQDFFLDGKPYLSAQQLTALLSKVEGKDRLVVMLAGLLGMRGGEIAGLTGDAYTGMDLAIIRRVYRGVVDSVKTKSSTALLPVPKIIRESLDKFKCAPGTFIFGYKSGKPLDRDYFLQSVLIPVSTLAELPFVANFQVLRRSFATLFESFGATYSEVETMMRHSKRDIHLVYVQARRESILQKLDTMCEEIAGNLPEHVEIPVESSRETSQVFAIT